MVAALLCFHRIVHSIVAYVPHIVFAQSLCGLLLLFQMGMEGTRCQQSFAFLGQVPLQQVLMLFAQWAQLFVLRVACISAPEVFEHNVIVFLTREVSELLLATAGILRWYCLPHRLHP